MSTTPLFSLSGIGKRFGYRWVLRDVSLDIGQGAFTLLLGNNGAGKSTMMRMLCTLMRPSMGEIRFRGEPLRGDTAQARGEIGVISHESRCYPDLTAQENLKVFGTLYGVSALSGAIVEALERVGLSHAAGIPARAFSSGMLKRLSIARLMLYQPRALLLDEPHSGLDQESIGLLDQYLRDFQAGGGTTIMITHQFTGSVSLADQVVVLQQGRLMYNQPESGITPARCAALLQEASQQSASA